MKIEQAEQIVGCVLCLPVRNVDGLFLSALLMLRTPASGEWLAEHDGLRPPSLDQVLWPEAHIAGLGYGLNGRMCKEPFAKPSASRVNSHISTGQAQTPRT